MGILQKAQNVSASSEHVSLRTSIHCLIQKWGPIASQFCKTSKKKFKFKSNNAVYCIVSVKICHIMHAYDMPTDSGGIWKRCFHSKNAWMWIYVNLYTAHITSCLMAVYNSIEWDRTSACEGASGCRYQSIFDLTHTPNPCMKCVMKLEIDHNTGNYVPYSFR